MSLLMPKKVKYRKLHRGKLKGRSKGATTLAFGEYGLQALEAGWITARQIEAARIAISRKVRKGGKMWIRIFPDRPYTKKPLETRMGKGKGNVDHWYAVVKPGRIIYEIEGVSKELAFEALRLASYKLGIKTRLVSRSVELK